MNKGIATLELLIALGVLTIVMSGIVIISFGSQVVALDTSVATQALLLARSSLSIAREDVANEISLVATSTDNIFEIETKTQIISECVTQVETTVSWWQDRLRPQDTSLSTLVVHNDVHDALGGDCDTEQLEVEDWNEPQVVKEVALLRDFDNATIVDPSSLDVVRYGSKIYSFVTAHNIATETPDVLIVDVTIASSASKVSEFDFDPHQFEVTTIDVAGGFAFVGSDEAGSQLLIMGMNNPLNPGPLYSTNALPGVSGSQPGIESLYYNDEYLYVGTRRTAGPELHVFDVDESIILNDPAEHIGSVSLNHGVLDLVVRDDYAYISASATTEESCELIVLDVGNPGDITNPCFPGSENSFVYRAPGTFDGESIFVGFGGAILGRKNSQGNGDFHILDTKNLEDIASVGQADLDLSVVADNITSVAQRGDVLVLAVDGGEGIQIWNISDTENPEHVGSASVGADIVDMEVFENTIYVLQKNPSALLILTQ